MGMVHLATVVGPDPFGGLVAALQLLSGSEKGHGACLLMRLLSTSESRHPTVVLGAGTHDGLLIANGRDRGERSTVYG
ncbi:MAG: hypothetical protein GY835_03435 [bacterium]|nr:hypothetical protein [bacterium]